MDLLLSGLGDLAVKKILKYFVSYLSWSLLTRSPLKPPKSLHLAAEFEGDILHAVGEEGVRGI